MSLPRGSGPPTPAAVARALLTHIETYYAEHADDEVDPAVDPPARRYIAGGAPREVAWDLEAGQLTVAIERILLAHRPAAPVSESRTPGASRATPGQFARSVVLEVQMVRPAPALDFYGRLPERDELDAHGYLLAVDAGHLGAAVVDAVRRGVLIRENVAQSQVLIGDQLTLGPSGKVAAVAQMLTVPLL